jgi:hypothetical protein
VPHPLSKPVSKHATHVPKHRAPRPSRTPIAPRLARGAVVMSGLAVAATGLTVSGGVLSASPASVTGDLVDSVRAAADSEVEVGATDLEERSRDEVQVSRSERRTPRPSAARTAKYAVLGTAQGRAMTQTEDLSDADPRDIGRALLSEFGFSADQFSCLDALYMSESGWRVDADNPSSSAYGIPQALTSMHDLPADYMTSAESQIRWGLEYIQRAYGTPCGAWDFKQGAGWY